MTQSDLQDLLAYASVNHLMDKPFQEVYNMWEADLHECMESWLADQYLCSMEAHEIDYIDQAV